MTTTLNRPQIQTDEILFSFTALCHWPRYDSSYIEKSIDWLGMKGVWLSQCLPSHVQVVAFYSDGNSEYLSFNHNAFALHVIFNARNNALRAFMCDGEIGNIANLSG